MKVFLILIGCVAALLGAGCTASGAMLMALVGSDGYFETGTEHVAVDSSAIVSGHDQVDRVRAIGEAGDEDGQLSIRIRAASREPGQEIFIGVAPTEAFERYTRDARVDLVYDIQVDPTRIMTFPMPGGRDLSPPAEQDFWLASASGPGQQELVWKPVSDGFHVFVMNADGSPGLDADLSIGLKVDLLFPVAIFMAVTGVIVAVLGVVAIVAGARRKSRPAFVVDATQPWPPPPPPLPPPA